MNHTAEKGVELLGRGVLVVDRILLGFFIDCSCIERDMTQTYHIRSHVKVLMGFQCMRISWTIHHEMWKALLLTPVLSELRKTRTFLCLSPVRLPLLTAQVHTLFQVPKALLLLPLLISHLAFEFPLPLACKYPSAMCFLLLFCFVWGGSLTNRSLQIGYQLPSGKDHIIITIKKDKNNKSYRSSFDGHVPTEIIPRLETEG